MYVINLLFVLQVQLYWSVVLVIDFFDDIFYILDKNVILKLIKDNYIVTIVGRLSNCLIIGLNFMLLGVLFDEEEVFGIVVDVRLVDVQSMVFGFYGEIYVVESDQYRINRVRVIIFDGRIYYFVGFKFKCDCKFKICFCYDGKEILVVQVLFNLLIFIIVISDGIVYIVDNGNLRVFFIMFKFF